MAPSTTTPSNLHRAPVACLKCRKAKVRCLISQRLDRCERCISNNAECIFVQPMRGKARTHPYNKRPRNQPAFENGEHYTSEKIPEPRVPLDSENVSGPQSTTPTSHGETSSSLSDHLPAPTYAQPAITTEIRARIIATLATLKGKRGAPFSFVTSGESQPDGRSTEMNDPNSRASHSHQSFEQTQSTALSLKLSWLLRPLRANSRQGGKSDTQRSAEPVKMPSYVASMTLGQTMTDPIEGGMISLQASMALFEYFMIQMNAKWEYVLDPHVDTHSDVRRRSPLLFASILFCASKFTNFDNNNLVPATDPYMQSRLCSLARNLVIKTIAEGDRSIETMQAFYLLVCWKDEDDDVSYLHSGYAFRILHDLDLEQGRGDRRQEARRRRTWLALFRQDRQQSLFFMRRASLSLSDEDPPSIGDLETWLKMPHALPFDFVACCSADLRRLQSKLRAMIQKASSIMLPCLLELMDTELDAWRLKWHNHLEGEGRLHSCDDPSFNSRLLNPGRDHLNILVGVWEHSIRLNIASAILRQALMASMKASLGSRGQSTQVYLDLDPTSIEQVLSPETPGLNSSVEGAFGTIRQLLKFPLDDLRRAPDAILLLASNTALFLCLLLCLPRNGVLGPSFQAIAINLIREIAQRVRHAVKSPQDTLVLHSTYLDSLVELLEQPRLQYSSDTYEMGVQPSVGMSYSNLGTGDLSLDDSMLQAAQVLTDGIGGRNYNMTENDEMLDLAGASSQNLHMQSLANLLDGSFFWEIPPAAPDENMGS